MPWKRGNVGVKGRRAAAPLAWDGEAWEYLVEDGDSHADRQEQRCNQLGAEGWELVAVVPLSRPSLTDGGRTTAVHLFFKRRR